MSTDRTTLALPVDVARTFDHTTSQTQLSNNTFQGTPDDIDLLLSYIEDAEDEFRAIAGQDFGLRRVGTPGQRETFEQITYEVNGHEAYKRNFSRVAGNYLPQEVTRNLDHGRVLPFDSAEGDEAYIYRGLGGSTGGDEWEDVTADIGDTWDIIDHRTGTVVIHPIELARAMLAGHSGVSLAGGRLEKLRLAISYRHGALGGGTSVNGATTLAEDITDSQTGVVSVADAGKLFSANTITGSAILKVGTEYLRATIDPTNDQIEILGRAVRGTNAVDPDNGDRISYTPPSVRKAVAARAGMMLIQSGRYSAYAPGEEDSIDKGDILSRLEDTWNATVGAVG